MLIWVQCSLLDQLTLTLETGSYKNMVTLTRATFEVKEEVVSKRKRAVMLQEESKYAGETREYLVRR